MPARFSLEIPDGLTFDEYRRVANDKLRRIQEALEAPIKLYDDLDAGGKRIVNLGGPKDLRDAVTRAFAEGLPRGNKTVTAATVTTATPTTPTAATGSQLLLYVPGVLSVRSSAAPLVAMAVSRTPTGVNAYLKRPAQGGEIRYRIKLDGAAWAEMTIAAGNTTGELSAAGLSQLTQGRLIEVDILAVPQTFPGADLTISIGLG